jgi:hypothetical protein
MIAAASNFSAIKASHHGLCRTLVCSIAPFQPASEPTMAYNARSGLLRISPNKNKDTSRTRHALPFPLARPREAGCLLINKESRGFGLG